MTRKHGIRALVLLATTALLVAGWLGFDQQRRAPSAGHAAHSPMARAAPDAAAAPRSLPDAPTPAPRDGFLSGWVVDVDGKRVAGAAVVLDDNPDGSVESDVDGIFVLDNVGPGAHWLSARLEDRLAGPTAAVVDPATGGIELRLRRAAGLEVSVVDGRTRAPIAGALVELRSTRAEATLSDASGSARLLPVEPGRRTLSVSADGYASSHDTVTIAGNGSGFSKHLVQLQRGLGMSGKVVDESGQPIAGAQLDYARGGELLLDPVKGSALSDARGDFQLQVPSGGEYRVTARHSAFAPALSELVQVGPQGLTGILIKMRQGGTVSGRVLTRQGAAVPNARIQASAWGGGYGKRALRDSVADSEGRFELAGLPRSWVNVVGATAAASSAALSVDLLSTSAARDVELVLEHDGRIHGVVVTRAGTPVPGANVVAVPAASPGDSPGSEVSVTRADQRGAFALEGLAPEGRYRVYPVEPGAAPSGINVDLPYVEASPGAELKLVLAGDGSVRGRVQFDDGTSPSRVSVSVGHQAPAEFSGDGAFELERVPAGETALRISGPDFAPKVLERTRIAEDQLTDLGTIIVDRGRQLSGRVVAAGSGAPVSGASIFASRKLIGDGRGFGLDEKLLDHSLRSAQSGPDGTFVLKGLSATESVTLAAEHPTLGKSQPLLLSSDAAQGPIELTLEGTGRVVGTVTLRGAPAEGIMLTLAPTREAIAGVAASAVMSALDGSFSFSAVSPGEYALFAVRRVGEDDIDSERLDITVQSGAEVQHSFDLTRGTGSLTVSIAASREQKPDQAGDDYYSATLTADSSLVRDLTERQPARFTEVEAGTYELCVYRLVSRGHDQAPRRGKPTCQEASISSGQSSTLVVGAPGVD